MNQGSIVLYTPGHSLYTDTLIMYALAHELRYDPSLVVEGLGTHYRIKAEVDLDDLVEALSVAYEGIRSEPIERRLRRLLSERDFAMAEQALQDTSKLRKYLHSLEEPGHARNEGRLGKGSTLKLPLMPTAGKYLHTDLMIKPKYDTKQYKVCGWCVALGILGLAYGSLILSLERHRLAILFAFEGKVDHEYFGRFFEFMDSAYLTSEEMESKGQVALNELRRSLNALPLRSVAYATVLLLNRELIVTMEGTKATWKALTARFDTARAVQVRGYQSLELDALLSAAADIIRMSEEGSVDAWSLTRDMVISLIRKARIQDPKASYALDSLGRLLDFLVERRPELLYYFARNGYRAFNRRLSAVNLCKALFELICS